MGIKVTKEILKKYFIAQAVVNRKIKKNNFEMHQAEVISDSRLYYFIHFCL